MIPLKHALELTHVLEHMDSETVSLQLDDSQITVSGEGVRSGTVRYISRVVDGQFPNYKEIIPKKSTTEATVLKSDFAEVLRKARILLTLLCKGRKKDLFRRGGSRLALLPK